MKIQKIRTDKRGISPVIATILLILITVAAVSILAAFIYPMIKENTETATVCFDAQQQVQIETANGRTCFNQTSYNVSVQIKKNPGTQSSEVTDVQIILTDTEGNTIAKLISKDALNSKTLPSDNEAKTFIVNSSNKNITKVAIAPIVKTGNTENPCDAGQAVNLPACT